MSDKQRKYRPARCGRAVRVAIAAGTGVGAVMAVGATPAAAQDFTVLNLSDSGPGSLRVAVESADARTGSDRILFASGLTGEISIGSVIRIDDSLSIAGPGPDVIAVDGGGTSGIFEIGSGESGGDPIAVGVSGLALRDGGQRFHGGAIESRNTNLSLSGLVLTENSAEVGGAVYAGLGGTLAVSETTFAGNVGGTGGAVALDEIDAEIGSSTFSRNNGLGAGGAIAAGSAPGPFSLEIENTTFNRNIAGYLGGAIASLAEVEANGTLAIRSSTISGNQATAFGGGIGSGFSSASVDNSVIEGNFASYGPDLSSGRSDEGCGCYPPTEFDSGFSFIGDAAGATIVETIPGSNIVDGGDALLGQLADNGGPTRTMAPTPDSPVVNKGSSPLTTDQRGQTRPVLYPGTPNSTAGGANGADMGAFELQYVVPPKVNGPFRILGSTPNPSNGTAMVRVRVPAPGSVRFVGYGRLKKVKKYFAAKGVYRFKARPKGKLRKHLSKRGRVRVLVKFHYNPDSGRTLDKGRVFPFVKRFRGARAAAAAVRDLLHRTHRSRR